MNTVKFVDPYDCEIYCHDYLMDNLMLRGNSQLISVRDYKVIYSADYSKSGQIKSLDKTYYFGLLTIKLEDDVLIIKFSEKERYFGQQIYSFDEILELANPTRIKSARKV